MYNSHAQRFSNPYQSDDEIWESTSNFSSKSHSTNQANSRFSSNKESVSKLIKKFNLIYGVEIEGYNPPSPVFDTLTLNNLLHAKLSNLMQQNGIGFHQSMGYTIPCYRSNRSILNVGISNPMEVQNCIGVSVMDYMTQSVSTTASRWDGPNVVVVTEAVCDIMDLLVKLDTLNEFSKSINCSDQDLPQILLLTPDEFDRAAKETNSNIHTTNLLIIDGVHKMIKDNDINFKSSLSQFYNSTNYIYFTNTSSKKTTSYLQNFGNLITVYYSPELPHASIDKRINFVNVDDRSNVFYLSEEELDQLTSNKLNKIKEESKKLAIDAKLYEIARIKKSFLQRGQSFGSNVVILVQNKDDAMSITEFLRWKSIDAFYRGFKLSSKEQPKFSYVVESMNAVVVTHNLDFVKGKQILIDFKASKFKSYIERLNQFKQNGGQIAITLFTINELKYFDKYYNDFLIENDVEIPNQLFEHLDARDSRSESEADSYSPL
ncbi:uncharacterized protein KGF55_001878 [Candida pseudojiufengensis]|uniref:uncharacterized protein n=1 Tax=Candida pseudojiufengensis TaxID=497109 RepID=UPI0022251326|nr:uncharacterized protein KGF55_001878 [Candida pseudojiufengensis]KAI5964808.1 hypothetical protein KGF55_001878 [Candida pseudojiufengensis]